ncbi:DUF4279 domain-containing protein [bacterium]|nr:MAG: DUF4279 domain-containing protein [bacterium]
MGRRPRRLRCGGSPTWICLYGSMCTSPTPSRPASHGRSTRTTRGRGLKRRALTELSQPRGAAWIDGEELRVRRDDSRASCSGGERRLVNSLENSSTDLAGPCERTYATLYLRHASSHPQVVTNALSIEPTEWNVLGDPTFLRGGVLRTRHPLRHPRTCNIWGVSTERRLGSREMCDHIDLLLSDLVGRHAAFAVLLTQGWEPEISTYWRSRHGYGGPWLGPSTLSRLGTLGVPLSIDFYDSAPE